jgi:hypothetical protein
MFYIVELEGYSDGHPYVASRHATLGAAHRSLKEHRENEPKLRYRLIHVLEEFA